MKRIVPIPCSLTPLWLLGGWLILVTSGLKLAANEPVDTAFFETRIRPVLHEHCYSCHAADAKIVRGGLLVDSKSGLLEGGDSGPAVVPGDPQDSLLIDALKHESFEMPPDERLPDAVIADFQRWVEGGAPDPRLDTPTAPPTRPDIDPQDHWAFQPVTSPKVPLVADEQRDWIRTPIDAFVAAKLQQQGWHPAPPADKYTLLRRVTFDLIGLPPSEAEIAAFIADDSPESFQRVVDRLLASPYYGQRWGRHWLDLVRYADTNGADENHKMPNAWRYRDWVFQALNRDQPLDEFITHQLAGDLLINGQDEATQRELLTATGMLVIGPKMLAEQDKAKMRIDIVDEQIDTVSRTMFGMTVACARCHDHKFDPISAEDYYALAGIFSSTRTMEHEEFVSKWMERELPSQQIEQRRAEHRAKVEAARKTLDEKDEAAMKKFKALEAAMPAFDTAMAVEEAAPLDIPVHIRGNHLRTAEQPTPRGVPQVLTSLSPLPDIPDDRSGRLELAQWLVDPQHPLTGRVMANRIWMWHFGQALMRSPSNFGYQSEAPEHRELLDWLTRRLIDDGWSMKRLHRMILLSSTYQMSSRPTTYQDADPENVYLWRQNRRRLEAEPLRDAIYVAGDSLDLEFDGKPGGIQEHRRTVYLSINRAALIDYLSTFDYVETANHIEQRPVTTVPNQALFLLNNAQVHQQAGRLAKRVVETVADDSQRVQTLWLKLYGRPAEPEEAQLATQFVTRAAADRGGEGAELHAWSLLIRTLIAGSSFSYVD
ncbi:PSD1 and planctomycete cytochrome C domain-containing protein [Roseimaritima ulvae]|uniref:Planctomycete cytochrome C n=1 Tax=Roseimaritima ulvae TaxID=980254 RepID=A0A5B9R075_9BACT|nr:PSD1 and planctomycete cytochrome C domain-containing protein [Roseimaritima ulvae]QEG43772.1 Planctomycete cytochrome C [Roseimaritima ulvae]